MTLILPSPTSLVQELIRDLHSDVWTKTMTKLLQQMADKSLYLGKGAALSVIMGQWPSARAREQLGASRAEPRAS